MAGDYIRLSCLRGARSARFSQLGYFAVHVVQKPCTVVNINTPDAKSMLSNHACDKRRC